MFSATFATVSTFAVAQTAGTRAIEVRVREFARAARRCMRASLRMASVLASAALARIASSISTDSARFRGHTRMPLTAVSAKGCSPAMGEPS